MKLKIVCAAIIFISAAAELAWSCNQYTYAGCSSEQLRAIQQQQFNARKRQPVSADDYWRDRQYADRLRLEERNYQRETEKIRSETAVEIARQERRSWRRGGYYFQRPPVIVHPRPPVIVHPRPTPPIVVEPHPHPEAYVQETVKPSPTYRRVPNAVQ